MTWVPVRQSRPTQLRSLRSLRAPLAAGLLLLALPAAALADPPAPAFTEDVVVESEALSIRPLALLAHGIFLEHDHFWLPPWFSAAVGLGWKRGANGDYLSDTFSASLEARFWLERLTPFHEPGKARMIGPYAALRIELELVDVLDRKRDRSIGRTLYARELLMLGLRSTIEPAELTPSCGLGVIQEGGVGVLTTGSRFDIVCGLTAGVLF